MATFDSSRPIFADNRPNPPMFTIKSNNPDITFRAEFGNGPALMTDGYGGWVVVDRPKEIGIVEWQGRHPMAIDIPFIIDHYFDEDVVDGAEDTEAMVKKLERLCGIGTHERPPKCIVDGEGGIPHDNDVAPGSHKWVIENVAWDAELEYRRPGGRRRLRCGGVITIRQYITADGLDRLNKKKKNKKKDQKKRESGHSSRYTVKKGDTLSSIAAKVYGNASRWHDIGDANNIRDPKNLKIGQVLTIP